MGLIDDLIYARIALANLCDGFSVANSSKNNILSIKIKILFMLEEKDQTPSELISTLCIAKSNLANMLRSLIEEGLVESYKNLNNYRNINYHLTDKGRQELNFYKHFLFSQIHDKINNNPELTQCFEDLTKNLTKIIRILRRDTDND